MTRAAEDRFSTSSNWNGFLDDAIANYDNESKYYSSLLTRMTEAGIRATGADKGGTSKSPEKTPVTGRRVMG